MPGARPVAAVYDCRAWLLHHAGAEKSRFSPASEFFLNYVVDEAVLPVGLVCHAHRCTCLQKTA